MYSRFSDLGDVIDRKSLMLHHYASRSGPNHKAIPKQLAKMLDAYALARLNEGKSAPAVSAEIIHVFNVIIDQGGLRPIAKAVEGAYLLTALGLLQRDYKLTGDEARLALSMVQLATCKLLIVPVEEATVEEVVPA